MSMFSSRSYKLHVNILNESKIITETMTAASKKNEILFYFQYIIVDFVSSPRLITSSKVFWH